MRLDIRSLAVLVMAAALCVSTVQAAKADKERIEKEPGAAKAKAERTVKAGKQQAEKEVKAAGKQAKEEKAKADKPAEAAKKQVAEKGDRAQAGVEGAQQQAEAVAEKLTREQQKHIERQIRLERMLQVAQEKGDEKAVERIQSLIAKENERYNRKLDKTTAKQDRVRGKKDAEAAEPVETEQ